jgi:hypothetical protein
MDTTDEGRIGLRDRALRISVVTAGLLGVAGSASATTAEPVPPTMNEQFKAEADKARDSGMEVLSDNIIVLLALPVAWVGYKVVRKVIAKVG